MYVFMCVYVCSYMHTCKSSRKRQNEWVTGECIHFKEILLVMMMGAGDLTVNTTVPVLKKLINYVNETANNNSRKYSVSA